MPLPDPPAEKHLPKLSEEFWAVVSATGTIIGAGHDLGMVCAYPEKAQEKLTEWRSKGFPEFTSRFRIQRVRVTIEPLPEKTDG